MTALACRNFMHEERPQEVEGAEGIPGGAVRLARVDVWRYCKGNPLTCIRSKFNSNKPTVMMWCTRSVERATYTLLDLDD